MHRLQEAGVPCGVVQSGEDLFHDPHLRARDFIGGVDHPLLGHMPMAALPLRVGGDGIEELRSPDLLGAHTEYAICELLGHSHEQLESWQAEGVLE